MRLETDMFRRCCVRGVGCAMLLALCGTSLAGCYSRSASRSNSQAAPAKKPLALTTLATGDELGVSLYEHYVIVATLRGENKPYSISTGD